MAVEGFEEASFNNSGFMFSKFPIPFITESPFSEVANKFSVLQVTMELIFQFHQAYHTLRALWLMCIRLLCTVSI